MSKSLKYKDLYIKNNEILNTNEEIKEYYEDLYLAVIDELDELNKELPKVLYQSNEEIKLAYDYKKSLRTKRYALDKCRRLINKLIINNVEIDKNGLDNYIKSCVNHSERGCKTFKYTFKSIHSQDINNYTQSIGV